MFKRLPFGINCAPEYFSKIFYKLVAGIPGIEIHIDDILIYAATVEEHDRILHQVLEKLREEGITLNKEKCKFRVNTIDFVVHQISQNGVCILPDRIKAICEYPVPNNKQKLLQFLGMVNVSSKYLPHRFDVLEPLNSSLCNDVQFIWEDKQRKAFKKIKQLLQIAPTLAHYDYRKKVIIQADASSYGVGGVLMQESASGDREVVSTTLSQSQQKYSHIEKEALSLGFSADKFKDYITGINVILETNHKPLLQILQTKPLDDLTPRLQRIRLRLMRFNYTVIYVPGKQLVLADALSRNPIPGYEANSELEVEMPKFIHFIINNIPTTDCMLEKVRIEQEKDELCSKLKEYCIRRWPHLNKIPSKLRPYYPFKGNISLV